ncbi:hypothetical protein ISTM_209 [Insectomime virus]|uniref:Uncharacterized protein n=1 Tax=Tunisvirus fontaine2 TaxID=1421067 RepID=V9SG11_9VIRU|nr:hypothetical protein D1R32_gp107 [Tunisvirus fontaine2]AHA46107.1 hypothetical protein ISTM_209 [Insectomime virus]AHC54824.1 hypothetical protein TNS_ORF106 [Tunisvirus fontaine2]
MSKVLKLEPAPKTEEGFPFAFESPQYPGMKWFCSRDEEGKITSVTLLPDRTKKIDYLESVEKARQIRRELKRIGWIAIQPNISITLSDE